MGRLVLVGCLVFWLQQTRQRMMRNQLKVVLAHYCNSVMRKRSFLGVWTLQVKMARGLNPTKFTCCIFCVSTLDRGSQKIEAVNQLLAALKKQRIIWKK